MALACRTVAHGNGSNWAMNPIYENMHMTIDGHTQHQACEGVSVFNFEKLVSYGNQPLTIRNISGLAWVDMESCFVSCFSMLEDVSAEKYLSISGKLGYNMSNDCTHYMR